MAIGTGVLIYRFLKLVSFLTMADDFKMISRDDPSNGAVDIVSHAVRTPFELSPREPHLYDYLLILRKHQWLIVSFMLAVVTIVSIATFRMQPVYVATTRIELGRENANILPFQGTDSYDYMFDRRELHRDAVQDSDQ